MKQSSFKGMVCLCLSSSISFMVRVRLSLCVVCLGGGELYLGDARMHTLHTKQSALHVISAGLSGTKPTLQRLVELWDDDATDYPRRSPIESKCNSISVADIIRHSQIY